MKKNKIVDGNICVEIVKELEALSLDVKRLNDHIVVLEREHAPKLILVELTHNEWELVVSTFNKVFPGPEKNITLTKIQKQIAKAILVKGA
jgi:hypothetical protein